MGKSIKLPVNCPSCEGKLKVNTLNCDICGTNVNGSFELPILARLDSDEQDFILHFVKQSGSLKEMARHLGLSYPSVRNRLDGIIAKIKTLESNQL